MNAFLRALPALVAAATLLSSRFFAFAAGIPMVGTVWLGAPPEGGSGLSWAGDTRLITGVVILLLAAGATGCRSARWSGIFAGLALGWIAAFGYGGIDWYFQQQAMLTAMMVDSSQISLKLGGGFFLMSLGALSTLVHTILIARLGGSQYSPPPEADKKPERTD